MLVAASFVMTRLDLMEEHWRRHSILREVGRIGTNKPIGRDVDLGGRFLLINWPDKTILAERTFSCPAGFDRLGPSGGPFVLASMRQNELYVTDSAFQVQRVVSNPLFNDLHSVSASRSGVLVTSTGLDAILEISSEGDVVWTWFAFQHGFAVDQFGNERFVDVTSTDHRLRDYPTLTQTTHVNAAIEDPSNSAIVYASLFHQGAIIRIDKVGGCCEVVYDGLRNCHGLRAVRINATSGYSVANTRGGEVTLFDTRFTPLRRISFDSDWIADAYVTDRGTCIIADAASNRIVECDWHGHECSAFHFDPRWRIYQAQLV
jgi:hypothetical protein